MDKFVNQSMHVIFGADITLKNIDIQGQTVLDEGKIRNTLDKMLKENGGKVEHYTLVASPVTAQMAVTGREAVEEYLLGTGLTKQKSKVARV